MNIYEEDEAGTLGLDIGAATAELKATGAIQADAVRRGRYAELSAAALLDIAGSLRVLRDEAAGAMLPTVFAEVEEFTPGQPDDGPRDFLLEGDLVHLVGKTEPGEIVALGFDGDGNLQATVNFGTLPHLTYYASSLVRLVGDVGPTDEAEPAYEAEEEAETVDDELEDGTDPDLYDSPAEAEAITTMRPDDGLGLVGSIGVEDAVAALRDDIDADFGDEPHPLAESAVDVLKANEAKRKAEKKAATKKGSKK